MTTVGPSRRETFDAAIVGAGVMGCATALHLAGGGMRCILVDRGAVCGEAAMTANATPARTLRIGPLPWCGAEDTPRTHPRGGPLRP